MNAQESKLITQLEHVFIINRPTKDIHNIYFTQPICYVTKDLFNLDVVMAWLGGRNPAGISFEGPIELYMYNTHIDVLLNEVTKITFEEFVRSNIKSNQIINDLQTAILRLL